VLLHGVCNSVYQIVQIQIHTGSVGPKRANLVTTNEAIRIVHERRRRAFSLYRFLAFSLSMPGS
jgi:hypothetical protein